MIPVIAWHRELWSRLKTLWGLKLLAGWVIAIVFFAGYFALLNFPTFQVTMMPVTAVDRLITFSPLALLLYVSLWIYVPLAPGLLNDRRELIAYYGAMIGLSIAGMSVFFFWPTVSPRPDIDWAQYPAFGPLLDLDGSGNALPSLHAAFAIFSAIWLDRLLHRIRSPGMLRGLNWCWCLGIVYSALATKQHVAVDVIAGSALGWVGAVLHLRLLPFMMSRSSTSKP